MSFADSMAIDQKPFPMIALDLQGKKVLIRPEAARSANPDNVVVGEPRDSRIKGKTSSREIMIKMKPNGKDDI